MGKPTAQAKKADYFGKRSVLQKTLKEKVTPKTVSFCGVRQMQTADLQTRTWVSLAKTSVSQTSTLIRLFRLVISDGDGNTIYNLQVCSLHMSHTDFFVITNRKFIYWDKLLTEVSASKVHAIPRN